MRALVAGLPLCSSGFGPDSGKSPRDLSRRDFTEPARNPPYPLLTSLPCRLTFLPESQLVGTARSGVAVRAWLKSGSFSVAIASFGLCLLEIFAVV